MNKEVEYLKEHLYEIYKYKKSMKDLTYDMDLEHLLRTCKALDYLQQELERYKNIIDELERYIKTEAKIEIYGDKTGLRTFVDGQDLLDKLKELKGSDE